MVGRPANPDKKAPLNRLRDVRKRLHVTVPELMDRTGKTKNQVYRAESGDTEMTIDDLMVYSRALGVGPEQLLPSGQDRLVPVRGYVGAGAEVFPFDDEHPNVGLAEVECPADMDQDDTEAYWIAGDSMLPIEPGSIVFISKSMPGDLIGHHCLVELDDGRRLFKNVRRGSRAGRFNLVSSNAPLIEDVVVRRAARVRHIRSNGAPTRKH